MTIDPRGILPAPTKLPEHVHITQPLSYADGWFAYYIEAESRKVIVLPVVGWAVVTYKTGEGTFKGKPHARYTEELRPFVATLMGQLVDYLEIPFPLICVLGPAVKDHGATVKSQLREADIDVSSVASN